MSAPLQAGAVFRYTENGQEAYHHLGAALRNPVANRAQEIHAWSSADLTTRRVISIGSGVSDLTATIRFDGDAWALEEFIAAGRRGATLDYIPSISNPSLSFPCVLIDDGGVVSDPQFGTQRRYACDVRLRRIDGGNWRALLEAPLFYLTGGNTAPGLTFTRSGAVGPYTDSGGVLQSAAANIWRTEWSYENGGSYPDTPWLLLENQGKTNLVTSDDLTAWSVSGTPVVTGSISDPAGGTGAYTVEDNNGAGLEFIYRTVSFTADDVKVVTFVVRENTHASDGSQGLVLYDSSAAADRLRLTITAWTNGEPSVTASTGTLLGVRYVGNGYWAIAGRSTTVTAANTNRLQIEPGGATATGSIDVYRANAYNAQTPGWSILDQSEALGTETFYSTFPHAPQAMCGLIDFRELQTPTWTIEGGVQRRLMHIGGSGNGQPRLIVYRQASTDGYYINHGNNIGAEVSSSVDLNPSWGDRVQVMWWLNSDGSVQIAGRTQALGSSTWSSITTGSASAALQPFASAWQDTRLYLGSVASVGRGSQMYRRVAIMPGSGLTAAELAAL